MPELCWRRLERRAFLDVAARASGGGSGKTDRELEREIESDSEIDGHKSSCLEAPKQPIEH